MGGGHCLKLFCGVTVHRRERAVRRSQNRIRRARDPECGKVSMRADTTSGRHSDDVLGQSQRIGRDEARRHAEFCGYRRHRSQASSRA